MAKDWKYIERCRKMKHGYFKKLRELQTYGKENRIPERIKETKESIWCLHGEIKEYYLNLKR